MKFGEKMIGLSQQATALWGKKKIDENGIPLWLPLIVHMIDTKNVGNWLYNWWLSDGQKKLLTQRLSEDNVIKLVQFICYTHDIGKATPAFQIKKSFKDAYQNLDSFLIHQLVNKSFVSLDDLLLNSPGKSRHACAGEAILEDAGLNETVAAVIGGHHGKTQRGNQRSQIVEYAANYYQSDCDQTDKDKAIQNRWKKVQKELIDYGLQLTGFHDLSEVPATIQPEAVILEGLLIMADWLASSEYLNNDPGKPMFNMIALDQGINDLDMIGRYEKAISTWAVNDAWIPEEIDDIDEYYTRHFSFKPRRIQVAMEKIIRDTMDPGVIIIEAEMGIGKTEIALTAAEQLAYATGRTGVYIGLPTQATTNAMFDRVNGWLHRIARIEGLKLDIKLLHGKANWNSRYTCIPRAEDIESGDSDDGTVTVNSWFEGKKSILADFTVGTIDNLLLMGLKQKHLFLRHLGFSSKVIVIDEVHAYDAYMNSYLSKALEWLGAYHVPVIILSATLPKSRRNHLIFSYFKGKYGDIKNNEGTETGWERNGSYPLLSILDGKKLKQYSDFGLPSKTKKLLVDYIDENPSTVWLEVSEKIKNGGIAGIIVNTVKRAQEFAKFAQDYERTTNGKSPTLIKVLHSAFLATDRSEHEKEILRLIGKNADRPEKLVVIGTQVLEQSLDIDFDVLFTDIAPIDLLLQRAGRLHRHEICRPQGLEKRHLYIMKPTGNDYGSANETIYEKYYLQKTEHFLPTEISIPDDISKLVQLVYDESTDDEIPDLTEAKEKLMVDFKRKKDKAKTFQINSPVYPEDETDLQDETWVDYFTIHHWLDRDKGDLNENQASAAVRDIQESIEVILLKEMEGEYFLLNGIKVEEVSEIDLAQQVIRLPHILTLNIEQAIKHLETITMQRFPEWQQSSWLKESLALVLDEHMTCKFMGYQLRYSSVSGLSYEKEGIE